MKIVVVLPAYNCEKTLAYTLADIPKGIVDEILLVDDCSKDSTYKVAKELGIKHIVKHKRNLGYGANQKSCYRLALSLNADVVIMLHPDYQYSPKLISDIVDRIKDDAKIVFCSRMLNGKEAIRNGMPIYKYYANRFLTIFQNLLLNKKMSEYHTGYRAYSKDVLLSINYEELSNDFIFDNQMILEAFKHGYDITEIYCPAKYEKESSSIKLVRSIKYGLFVVYNTLIYKFIK